MCNMNAKQQKKHEMKWNEMIQFEFYFQVRLLLKCFYLLLYMVTAFQQFFSMFYVSIFSVFLFLNLWKGHVICFHIEARVLSIMPSALLLLF